MYFLKRHSFQTVPSAIFCTFLLFCLLPNIGSGQPFNPTVEIKPSTTPSPAAPSAPVFRANMPNDPPGIDVGGQKPSLWLWDYIRTTPTSGTETPNIIQTLYLEKATGTQPDFLASTQWGIARTSEKMSWASSEKDAVINVEGNDLLLANLRPDKSIHLSTTRKPPIPEVPPVTPAYLAYDSVRFTVTHDGKIGINQKSPTAPLEIRSANTSATWGSYDPVLLRLSGYNSLQHYGIDFKDFGFFISNGDWGKVIDYSWEERVTPTPPALPYGRGTFLRLSNQIGNDPGETPVQDAVTLSDYEGIQFETKAVQRMVISPDGFVGIGTPSRGTGAYASQIFLGVEGLIKAKEIRVSVSDWADDVFAPGYFLRPLNDLDKEIRMLGHLPDVPSAARVEEEGIGLAETSAMLLRKIEELTLYLIEQSREIAQLKLQMSQTSRSPQFDASQELRK